MSGGTIDPQQVEIAAEAMAEEADGYFWSLLTPDEREPYYARARAAIEALQLTEEVVVLNEYAARNGEPEQVERRLVGPWRKQ